MADVFELFIHNWADQVSMSTTWDTAVAISPESQLERRVGLVGSPRRTIRATWQAVDQQQAQRLLFTLARSAHQRLRVPLYQDAAELTAPSSGSTLPFDSTDRRFYAGRRVAIFDPEAAEATRVTFALLTSVADASSTIDSSPSAVYPAGSIVVPVLDVELRLQGDAVAQTDENLRVSAEFTEVLVEALPRAATLGDLSGLHFATDQNGNDHLLFVESLDWGQQVQVGILRAGYETPLGRDQVVVARGTRPQFTFDAGHTVDRSGFGRLLRFFDALQGRLVSFVCANPLTVWTPLAIAADGSYLDVEAHGAIDDPQAFAAWIWFEFVDGTHYATPITGVTSVAGKFRLALWSYLIDLTGIGGVDQRVLANVTRVTLAHLARFAQDTLDETWQTTNLASVAFKALELLAESASGAAVESNMLLEFSYGDSPTVERYTDWSADVNTGELYTGVPALEVTLPPDSGTISQDARLSIKLPRGVSVFADASADAEAWAPVTLQLTQVLNDPGSNGVPGEGSDSLNHGGDWLLVSCIRSPNDEAGLILLEFAPILGARLSVPMGRPAGPECPFVLGDASCQAVIPTFNVVVSVIDRFTLTTSTTSAVTGKPSGYYRRGVLTRDGLSIGIRDWVDGSVSFSLIREPPASWVGQTVVLRPGCNKQPSGCATFANTANFGGTGWAIPSKSLNWESS